MIPQLALQSLDLLLQLGDLHYLVPLKHLQSLDVTLSFFQPFLEGLKLSLPNQGTIKSIMH